VQSPKKHYSKERNQIEGLARSKVFRPRNSGRFVIVDTQDIIIDNGKDTTVRIALLLIFDTTIQYFSTRLVATVHSRTRAIAIAATIFNKTVSAKRR